MRLTYRQQNTVTLLPAVSNHKNVRFQPYDIVKCPASLADLMHCTLRGVQRTLPLARVIHKRARASPLVRRPRRTRDSLYKQTGCNPYFPCSQISSTVISAGFTPDIRAACPIVAGFTLSSFCAASSRSPLICE